MHTLIFPRHSFAIGSVKVPDEQFAFYASHPFLLPAESFRCVVYFRKAYVLTTTDTVLLRLLQHLGGNAPLAVLADALGFSIYNDDERKRYRDEAEEKVFSLLLAGLLDYELIEVGEGTVSLTQMGQSALSTHTKYHYFSATVKAYQLLNLTYPADFHFLTLLGPPQLSEVKRVWSTSLPPHPSNQSFLFASIKHQLESSEAYENEELLHAGMPYHFGEVGKYIFGHFFKHTEHQQYVVATFSDNTFHPGFSALLCLDENRHFLDKITLDCEYQVFLKDLEEKIDVSVLKRFESKWNYDTLFTDNRIQWQQEEVLQFFAQRIEKSHWSSLCEHIPTPQLCAALPLFSELGDWYWISSRLPEDFIEQHLLDDTGQLMYPWDFQAFSYRSAAFAERILHSLLAAGFNVREDVRLAWDWEELCKVLPDHSILQLLPQCPFDRYTLSEKDAAFLQAALAQPLTTNNRDWNWPLVQQKVGTAFIWNHIESLQTFINWNQWLLDVFASSGSLLEDKLVQKMKQLLTANRERIKPFASEPISLADHWITVFDNLGLLRWCSTSLSKGFEMNENLSWSYSFFKSFYSKITTPSGRSRVSAAIEDIRLLEEYPHFGWDWTALSENEKLVWTKELTQKYASHIKWFLFLQRYDKEKIAQRVSSLLELTAGSSATVAQEMWDYFNRNIPVRQLLELHTQYPARVDLPLLCSREPDALVEYMLESRDFALSYDYQALAQKASVGKLQQLLPVLDAQFRPEPHEEVSLLFKKVTPRFSSEYVLEQANAYAFDWDWSYLSRHLAKKMLVTHLARYKDKWDWSYLTQHVFTKEELLDTLVYHEEVKGYLDWPYILSGRVLSDRELMDKIDEISEGIKAVGDYELRKELWKTITPRVPIDFIFPSIDYQFRDWDYSAHFRMYRFDWEYLSGDERLHPYLTIGFLRKFQRRWHWDVLSQNQHINWKREYLWALREYWDWEYISQHSHFIKPQKAFAENRNIYNKFQDFIHWQPFSLRTDVVFEQELLVAFQDKPWDWDKLSESPQLELSEELLMALMDKPWNFHAFSANPKITITTELLIEFQDKDWDWATLSARSSLVPNDTLFEQLSNKAWDWQVISSRTNFDWTHAMLKTVAQKPLNWTALSASTRIPWDTHILNSFQRKWNWVALSANQAVSLLEIDFEAFADYWDYPTLSRRKEVAGRTEWLLKHKERAWDWKLLSQSEDFDFSTRELMLLQEKLYWNALSRRRWNRFDVEWLELFRDKWNWVELAANYSVSRDTKAKAQIEAFFRENGRWLFLRKLEAQKSIWKGFVYHYAHLKNAAGILNEQKIKCRKLATHDDQASQVIVHRKTEPHNYARFYFRPQTPYQFYTENLGREFPISIVEQYRFKNVEYPKCPVPIFIRLQLKEILIDKMVDCYVTDNNFHADDRNVRVMRVEEALNRFDFKGVYRKFENISRDDFSRELARYKKQVQQEFIVPKELDISKYEVEVICQSEQDKEALLNLLNEPHIWKERITVDYRNYSYDSYLRHNKKVWIEREGKKIVVQTEFMGKGELMIKSNKLENADGYLKGAPTEDTVIGYHYISAEVASESQPFDIFFIDESGKRWLIFSKN